MIDTVTVHTTGVNWDSVAAIVTAVVVVVSAIGAVVITVLKSSVTAIVEDAIKRDVAPILDRINARLDVHDTKLAHLEGVEQGRREGLAMKAP